MRQPDRLGRGVDRHHELLARLQRRRRGAAALGGRHGVHGLANRASGRQRGERAALEDRVARHGPRPYAEPVGRLTRQVVARPVAVDIARPGSLYGPHVDDDGRRDGDPRRRRGGGAGGGVDGTG
ncbi:MAG: hypothetical protein U0802_12330 [Candidatus Binatia bacterium]